MQEDVQNNFQSRESFLFLTHDDHLQAYHAWTNVLSTSPSSRPSSSIPGSLGEDEPHWLGADLCDFRLHFDFCPKIPTAISKVRPFPAPPSKPTKSLPASQVQSFSLTCGSNSKAKIFLNADENAATYGLTAHILDHEGLPVHAQEDARKYRDMRGNCRDSVRIVQGKSKNEWRGETFFIPYYAIGVGRGRRKLKVELRLRDLETGRLVGKSEWIDFAFKKPETRLFRVTMQDILTEKTDANGETWDYQFLNPREIFPDIRWGIRRGAEVVFQSDRQKNALRYEGEGEEDMTPYFALSNGDQITLYIHDFDMISFSDEIGSLLLDPFAPETVLFHVKSYAFGRVKEANFSLEGLNKPALDFTRFDVIEGEREKGVRGIRMRFDYKISPPAGRLALPCRCRAIVGRRPAFSRALVGDFRDLPWSIRMENWTCSTTKGQSRSFCHNMACAGPDHAKTPPLLRARAHVGLGKRQFDLGFRQQQIMRPDRPYEDMEFGQFKIGEYVDGGVNGLRNHLRIWPFRAIHEGFEGRSLFDHARDHDRFRAGLLR